MFGSFQIISHFSKNSSVSQGFRKFQLAEEMVKTRTIPYHPISNGLTESLNSTIISMIQKAVSEEEYDWDGHLSKLLMYYHSAVH